MNNPDFSIFQSPFSWRYGSPEMRQIFSEKRKYEIWRKIWVAIASAEHDAGLVSTKELEDLIKNKNIIDLNRILEIEKETKHDVVAAIREYSEKATIGGGKIHLGATSMDVVDNADVLRFHEAIKVIRYRTRSTLISLIKKIEKYAEFPCIGYTHLQPAEPTTVGYRLAFYAQDLLNADHFLKFAENQLKGKGVKGAVGTSASYKEMLRKSGMTVSKFEGKVMEKLGLEYCLITTQVYPRQFDYMLLSALAAIGSSLAKFAGDLRILQSPNIGEWSEGFGKNQVGSSAMPFKKNPISAENICSLARFVSSLPQVALENASLSYLERTLDDSANKRLIMPEAFLAIDQILITAEKIISGLVINEKRITTNLQIYAPFSATESILAEAVKNGADRQKIHEILKKISMVAWQKIQVGKRNPMKNLLINDITLKRYLKKAEIVQLFEVRHHIGDAPERTRQLCKNIRKELDKND
jgi:adenylosuccinate lyase